MFMLPDLCVCDMSLCLRSMSMIDVLGAGDCLKLFAGTDPLSLIFARVLEIVLEATGLTTCFTTLLRNGKGTKSFAKGTAGRRFNGGWNSGSTNFAAGGIFSMISSVQILAITQVIEGGKECGPIPRSHSSQANTGTDARPLLMYSLNKTLFNYLFR